MAIVLLLEWRRLSKGGRLDESEANQDGRFDWCGPESKCVSRHAKQAVITLALKEENENVS
jgi:hypothetical protein